MKFIRSLVVLSSLIYVIFSVSVCKKNNIVIFDAENTPDKKPFIITDKEPLVIKGNWDLSNNLDFLIDLEEVGGKSTILTLRISEGDNAKDMDKPLQKGISNMAKRGKKSTVAEDPISIISFLFERK